MNTHKNILLMGLIALGIIVGGFLSSVSSGKALITGAAFGGLLGGLLYCVIQMIASRRKKEICRMITWMNSTRSNSVRFPRRLRQESGECKIISCPIS